MEKRLPKLKKKVNSFLLGEEGKISKKRILAGGALITGVALALNAKMVQAHTNSITHANAECITHSSHASHSAHGNHGNHGSHGNHSSGW